MTSTSVPIINPDSSQGETITIEYRSKPGLGWLSVKNFLLNIITLGIYRFWAKTDVRRHIWSCVHINNEPLEYTGTGSELFLGFLVVIVVIFVPYIALVTALQVFVSEEVAALVQLLFTFIVFLLVGMAIYRARRYRLSRTLWRGIRGTLTGSSVRYSLLYFASMLLAGMTAGWTNPALSFELQKRITNEMKFGETPFTFKGTSGPLYPPYALCWFSTFFAFMVLAGIIAGVFTAIDGYDWFNPQSLETGQKPDVLKITAFVFTIYGLIALAALLYAAIWSFYNARRMKIFAGFTGFDNARFELNATTFSLFWLWFGNLLLVTLTLGLASPFAQQRIIRYMCDRLHVSGTVDIAAIRQSTAPLDKRGEGLLDAFDIGTF